MSNILTMKNNILSLKPKMQEVLITVIEKYEQLLEMPAGMDIANLIKLLNSRANDGQSWLIGVFSNSIAIDTSISAITDFFSFTREKVIDLKPYRHLRINEDDLMTAFNRLTSLDTVDSFDSQAVTVIGSQADKYLPVETLEYRIVRLLCLYKEINILGTSNVLARFIVSQNSIISKDMLRISVEASDVD